MENASKALIIAGAILVSILLISVGIIVMNAINDPVQQGANTAASQAIEIFNSRFTGYVGEQKGSNVKQLVTSIMSSNGADPSHKIVLETGSTVASKDYSVSANGGFGGLQGAVKANKSYTVSFTYADDEKLASTTTGTGSSATTTPSKYTSEVGYICGVKIVEKQ